MLTAMTLLTPQTSNPQMPPKYMLSIQPSGALVKAHKQQASTRSILQKQQTHEAFTTKRWIVVLPQIH